MVKSLVDKKSEEDLRIIHEHLNSIRKNNSKPLTVTQIREALLEILKKIQENNPNAIIGYVAGCITSDGPEYVNKNIAKLEAYAHYLRNKFGPHIFSAKEIFSDEDQKAITEEGEKAQFEMRRFWRDVQLSGNITDVFMIPGWERSKGARDEHNAAKERGDITIHYVDKVPELE